MNLPALPTRESDSHKGDFGRALVIAGSAGMTGAATMAALAAMRSGAGLVTVATPASCAPIIAAFHPAYMVVGLEETASGQLAQTAESQLHQLLERMTCVAIGPGLGLGSEVQYLVRALYTSVPLPMIVDADGITALAGLSSAAPAERLFTPHLGEFRRLVGDEQLDHLAACELAPSFAGRIGATVLLKGHDTLVTNGSTTHLNQTGNPGMATAGSGDVLTGIILGLVAQGMPTYDAAVLGAYLHGLAGDMAAEGLGMHSMIATDMIDYLPSAFMEYDDPSPIE